MNFALRQRQGKVDSVKRTEQRWRRTSEADRKAFLGHAHENKDRERATMEGMRSSRKNLVKSNNSSVREERQRKEEDAAHIAETRAAAALAKQAVHDTVYGSRKISEVRARRGARGARGGRRLPAGRC